MKVTILDPMPGEEEELIIKCASLDENLIKLIHAVKSENNRQNVYKDGQIFRIMPSDVYYYETVDQKVFAYCKNEVYETKRKLYELEEELSLWDFARISKSVLLNMNKIRKITPAFNGRLEAVLQNGEKIIISRQYVAKFKMKLGL